MFEYGQGREFPDTYRDSIPVLKSSKGKSFFDKLHIAPWNLNISAESRMATGQLGSLLKFI